MSESLLAVDLGIRTGLALFDSSGQLRWYRSSNFGTTARLKRAVPGILREAGHPAYVAIEGGGRLLTPWRRNAERHGASVIEMHAATWREDLLLSRERRSGAEAKDHAVRLARDVIARSGAASPTGPLKDDVAEAIMVGLWAMREIGWIDEFPAL